MQPFSRWEAVFLVVALVVGLAWARIAAAPSIHNFARVHGDRMIWAPLAQVLAEADNGDVLLFASARNKFVRYVTDSPFTHVALVFRDRDAAGRGKVAYVWDADLGQGCRAGARVATLADKLARVKGGATIAGWKRLASPRPPTARVLRVISQYLACGMDHLMLRWAACQLFGTAGGRAAAPRNMFCSELVARTSQDLGLLRTDTPPVRYAPGDWHKNVLDLAPGVAYGPTAYFRFDPRALAGSRL